VILLDGKPVRFASVREAMNRGFAYVPEDRTTEASFAGLSVRENL
jgi:ABC-type sugar transport system ATPase subunit